MPAAAKPTPWEQLRKPFPPEQIGTIPKGGVSLSYVGHAAVTDRLLQVDPEWSWEPMGVDEHGRPIIAENEGGMVGESLGLWIKLTVNGVTRPGFGGGKNAKECISDAIRNAAMRFGVALDLWAKEDLSGATMGNGNGAEPKSKASPPKATYQQPPEPPTTKKQGEEILAVWERIPDEHRPNPAQVAVQYHLIATGSDKDALVEVLRQLTRAQADELLGRLTRLEDNLKVTA